MISRHKADSRFGTAAAILLVAMASLASDPAHADATRLFMPMSSAAQMTEKQSHMMHDAMSAPAAMGMTLMELPDPATVERALTDGTSGSALDSSDAELMLTLDKTTTVTATRTSVERTADGYIWHGVVVGTDDPVTLLWWPSGRISGQITYKDRHFVVRNLGGTLHGIVEMSPQMLPPEHAPMEKSLMKKMNMHEDPLVTKGDASMLRREAPEDEQEPLKNLQDVAPGRQAKADPRTNPVIPPASLGGEPVTIDLLVAYTLRAASHHTDIARDLIDVAIEEANQTFRNSGIANVRLRLVHAYETEYVEQGTHFEHVFRLADKNDGYMDEVHALRDKYKADVVALVVDDPNGCGLSAGVAPAARRAFTVVHHECAALSYSLAHEIGHLIGARHDIGLDDSTMPFPYGHGYVHGTQWRTIMSYEESCDSCPRLPIWSTPALKIRNVPAGDAMSDNARVIAQGAARVAAFR